MKEIVEAMEVLKNVKSPLADRRQAVSKLTEILDEDSAAVLQRLRVLLRPLQDQVHTLINTYIHTRGCIHHTQIHNCARYCTNQ